MTHMPALGRPLRFFAMIVALLALLGCSDQKAKWRSEGRSEAEKDLAAGQLRLKIYGLPFPWDRKYREMAWERLGVELDFVAGCIVDDELVERVAGYNEPMQREIDRRHGPGAMDKLAEAARAEYQRNEEGRVVPKP